MEQAGNRIGKMVLADLICGWGLEIFAMAVLCLMLSGMVLMGWLQMENSGYAVMAVLLTCSFIGAWKACRRAEGQWWLLCTLSGLLAIVTLIAANVFWYGGDLRSVGANAMLVLGGCGTALLIHQDEKRKKKGRKRRIKL